ncbi:MAG: hypothetical protein K8M05_33685 [Deltaproteobacteria bacterium]|nr:hypothetical protein [Kofleriaceae bacterium]
MHGVAIELRVGCAGCGQPIPINAFTPRITCSSCRRTAEMTDEQWHSLLEDAVDEAPELAVDEGSTSTIMTGSGTYQLLYGNQPPRCGTCKTPVPDAAAELAGQGRIGCVGCGKPMAIRHAPPQLQALGVKLVIGEDAAQLASGGAGGAATASAPRAANPVVLYCPHCKAPLSVDGSSRMVRCQYCSTDVYLPDELWSRLHPVAEVTRWYLVFGGAVDVAQRALARFKWSSLRDAIIDAHGNLYCVGEDDDHDFAVWCLGPDLQARWVRKGLDFTDNDPKLALDPRGRLILWQPHKHSLVRLSAADGSDLDRLGGRQPDDATTHTLDMDHAKAFLADVDGTYLALLHERLVRFAEDGTPVATWPPRSGIFGKRAEKLRPVYAPGHQLIDVDGKYVEDIGHHPLEVDDYTKLHLGADGRLFLERSERVACFDREGKRLWRTDKLPITSVRGDRMGTDHAGNLYLLGRQEGNPSPRVVLRISPDGERVDVMAGDRLMGGTVGDEDNLCVAGDGTLFLLGYGVEIRVLGPDGRTLYLSDRSKEEDADEDKERARRA